MSFEDLPERFHAKCRVNEETGCIEWTGTTVNSGYGQFRLDGEQLAHRVAYVAEKGQIPHGLQLDHLCRVRNCVSPEHLEAVTSKENHARRPPKTHCPYGHEFTEENTYVAKGGGKQCRACWPRRYAARKAKAAA